MLLHVPIYFIIENFGDFLGDAASDIKVCLPGESGNILDTVGGDLTTSLQSLSDSMTGLDGFDSTSETTTITDAWSLVNAGITDFYTGKTIDISDSSAIG